MQQQQQQQHIRSQFFNHLCPGAIPGACNLPEVARSGWSNALLRAVWGACLVDAHLYSISILINLW